MRPRTVRLLFLHASLLLPIALGCGGEAAPIRIGLVGPFSQPRGESMQLATELAVSEINGRGGIRGQRIQLVIRDDSGQARPAIRAAQELYDTPSLVAVIGHLTSGATLAAAPVYNGGGAPLPRSHPPPPAH